MKIRPVGAELFHTVERAVGRGAGGRTEMTKLIVAFRNGANAPKRGSGLWWDLSCI
jgi:hypothetical protein